MNLEKGNARLARIGKVLRKNFWSDYEAEFIGGKDAPDYKLYEGQLGFDKNTAFWLACDFDQKEIFQLLVGFLGYNLIFYWVDDGNMYSIFSEIFPGEVRCLPVKNHKRGIPIEDKYDPLDQHDDGNVVATFYRDRRNKKHNLVSDTLQIKGVPIMEVIKRSVIIEFG